MLTMATLLGKYIDTAGLSIRLRADGDHLLKPKWARGGLVTRS